ncbi:hypothetical protein DAEQUDRAFT_745875 [Daedalea quercina L-15889]|uniref:Uncharacterized protein n=1 Tax=Daedalea quercina L-15889 TaxID=1314783 RepID=A0A165PDE3_9APHY|nr:hypothetical protein DAEQUDRAFT_745875 [Daedalea quercina L-15889]
MATASSSRQQNPSRFSSLKVFKFPSASKPPPLPPKDSYYMYNPSLPSLNHSLSPDSASSQPPTPLSSQYTLMRTPSPSSTYTPSRPAASPAPSSTALSPASTVPAGFRQGLRKLSSFGRRPKTPKSAERNTADLQPPEPVEDPSISLPWNFQVRSTASSHQS